jgi:hypothetical protein
MAFIFLEFFYKKNVGQVAISEAISTTWHSSNCVMIYREREGKFVIQ